MIYSSMSVPVEAFSAIMPDGKGPMLYDAHDLSPWKPIRGDPN